MPNRLALSLFVILAMPGMASAQDMPTPERTGADYSYATPAGWQGDAPDAVYLPAAPSTPYPPVYPQAYTQTYPPPGADVLYPGMPSYDAAYAQATGGAMQSAYPAQRDAWLAECRARFLDRRGRDRSGVLGALIGAGVGGLVGNRMADGDRLLGTAVGAALGGVAGAAITSHTARRDGRIDDCERYLADWEARGPAGRPMHYVPVMIPVNQHAVIREEPVDEWIDEAPAAAPRQRVVPRRAAPAPRAPARRTGDKRIPLGR